MAKRHEQLIKLSNVKTAADVMKENLITVQEDIRIDEAISIMAQKGIKRLPVIDQSRTFMGMISRDSLLRTGVTGEQINKQN